MSRCGWCCSRDADSLAPVTVDDALVDDAPLPHHAHKSSEDPMQRGGSIEHSSATLSDPYTRATDQHAAAPATLADVYTSRAADADPATVAANTTLSIPPRPRRTSERRLISVCPSRAASQLLWLLAPLFCAGLIRDIHAATSATLKTEDGTAPTAAVRIFQAVSFACAVRRALSVILET